MLTLHAPIIFEVPSALWLQVKAASRKKDLKLKFLGAVDHLDDSMHEYKVRCSVSGAVVHLGVLPE